MRIFLSVSCVWRGFARKCKNAGNNRLRCGENSAIKWKSVCRTDAAAAAEQACTRPVFVKILRQGGKRWAFCRGKQNGPACRCKPGSGSPVPHTVCLPGAGHERMQKSGILEKSAQDFVKQRIGRNVGKRGSNVEKVVKNRQNSNGDGKYKEKRAVRASRQDVRRNFGAGRATLKPSKTKAAERAARE